MKQVPALFRLLTAVLFLLSGSVVASAADKVTLNLNWFYTADHSPFYMALKKGYFAEENIDLKIVRGFGSGDTAKKIDLKQAEFGISDTPTVLTAISKGADIKMVGIVFDKAANNVFFYKDSNITSVKDLAGKKLAAPPGDSHRFLWPALAAANGVDPDSVTLINVKPEGKQGIVAARHVDAAFDLYTGYPIWEKVLGKGNVGNLLFADHGVALYGHAYIVHKDMVTENPELIRRFLRATYKGWRDTALDPEGAIAALAEKVDGIDVAGYNAMLSLVLDLCVTERSRTEGLGWIMADLMQSTIDITYSGGKMDRKVTLEEVYTNAFNSKIKPSN